MAGAIRLELISAVLETVILPLNYTPMVGETGFEPASPLVPNQVRYQVALLSDNGCQSWVRTNKCRSQSPMCYHFTIWQFGVGNGT